MKNIKIVTTFFICLLLLSACSDDWKENALTAKFTFDKTTYYVGEEVSITNETVGGEGNYTCQWDLGNGETSTEVAPKVTYETNGAYTVTSVSYTHLEHKDRTSLSGYLLSRL